jgi:hypothetical protein
VSTPDHPEKSADIDDWGTTAKVLIQDFGYDKIPDINAIRTKFLQEPLAKKARELSERCGVNRETFITAASITIAVPERTDTGSIAYRLCNRRGPKYGQVRDCLAIAKDRYIDP